MKIGEYVTIKPYEEITKLHPEYGPLIISRINRPTWAAYCNHTIKVSGLAPPSGERFWDVYTGGVGWLKDEFYTLEDKLELL